MDPFKTVPTLDAGLLVTQLFAFTISHVVLMVALFAVRIELVFSFPVYCEFGGSLSDRAFCASFGL
jgi:hypothetical protein